METKFKTFKRCIEEIKAIDPDTALTEWFIRRLCKSGKVRCLSNGSKSLVDFDALIYFLDNYGKVQDET